jgi:NAD(P)-dependent dehydrogenase (short-subunit alcohol dehydrogenase family)
LFYDAGMAKQPKSLNGKVAVVTGGARGIGRATVGALAAKGVRVAIGDLDQDLAEQAAAEVGGGAIGLTLDVTDRPGFTAFLDEVEQQLGPIDILINNAGIMPTGPFDEETDESTVRQLSINLLAVMHGTKEGMKRMKPRRTGHIVNISSAAGKIAGAQVATYSAGKFAVAGFCESIAAELHGTGVEISCVYPSLTNTGLVSGLASMPGLKLIEPEDVAGGIVDALENPRFSVPVPRPLGFMLNFNQALPYKARAGLGRLMKADSVINNADRSARAEYEARVGRSVAVDKESEKTKV